MPVATTPLPSQSAATTPQQMPKEKKSSRTSSPPVPETAPTFSRSSSPTFTFTVPRPQSPQTFRRAESPAQTAYHYKATYTTTKLYTSSASYVPKFERSPQPYHYSFQDAGLRNRFDPAAGVDIGRDETRREGRTDGDTKDSGMNESSFYTDPRDRDVPPAHDDSRPDAHSSPRTYTRTETRSHTFRNSNPPRSAPPNTTEQPSTVSTPIFSRVVAAIVTISFAAVWIMLTIYIFIFSYMLTATCAILQRFPRLIKWGFDCVAKVGLLGLKAAVGGVQSVRGLKRRMDDIWQRVKSRADGGLWTDPWSNGNGSNGNGSGNGNGNGNGSGNGNGNGDANGTRYPSPPYTPPRYEFYGEYRYAPFYRDHGCRPMYGYRSMYEDLDDHPLYGDRGNRAMYGDSDNHPLYGDRGNRSMYGDPDNHPLYGDRDNRPLYGNRRNR